MNDDTNCFVNIETFEEFHIPDDLKFGECRCVTNFEKQERIGEGTYGLVYSARDIATKDIYALKKIKMDAEKDGFPKTTLREIQILMNIKHDNVVNLREVVVGRNLNDIYLVMDYCEQDLATLIDNMRMPFAEPQIKCILLQLFRGIKCLHDHAIIHRDLKVANLLITKDGVVKIADFGMSRVFSHNIKKMSPQVVTIWYRPPEVLFGADVQTPATDIWSCGCIMAELILNKPLLPGKGEIQQIELIIKMLGSPDENIWPDIVNLPLYKNHNLIQQPYSNLKSYLPAVSESCYKILNAIFVYDPTKRTSAGHVLQSDYFTESPPRNITRVMCACLWSLYSACEPCHIPILPRKYTAH